MPELKEKAISLLSSTTAVDMATTGAKTTLYTVPTGKTCYVTHIIVRDPSASMAGGVDYDFGTGASANTWLINVNLSDLTTSGTHYMVIGGNIRHTESAAAATFGIYPNSGTTVACTVTIDVFGYLV